jgi:YidC/Oxa1 family membrane protein insertase
VPTADVGIAIILVTIVVKLIIFPLSKKATRTQMIMKRIQPELNKLKEKYKDDRQKQAEKMMEIYRENEINPLSGLGLILIQLPLIFALYWIFFKGGLPDINTLILYPFIPVPDIVNMEFIGLVDMAGKSMILAAAAGITQYYQISLTLPKIEDRKDNASLKEDLARSFQLQMKYVMPAFVFMVAYFISAAVALYWLTSNIFAIGQEFVIRKQVKEKFKEE